MRFQNMWDMMVTSLILQLQRCLQGLFLFWCSCFVLCKPPPRCNNVLPVCACCFSQAMQYLPKIAGLESGDGHGGWLISSSRGLLVMWLCSAGGGAGMPSLMVSWECGKGHGQRQRQDCCDGGWSLSYHVHASSCVNGYAFLI